MQIKYYPGTVFQTILYLIFGFIIATPFAAPFIFYEKQLSLVLPKDLSMILIYLIVMSMLIFLAYFVNSIRNLNFIFNFKLVIISLLPFFLIGLFTFQLGLNLPFQKVLYFLIDVNRADSLYSWTYILSALIFAPFFEEILFRGIIFKGLLSTYSSKKAIIISAIIFGIFHGQPAMIPGAIFLGLCFGYVYFKTNSLGLTILLHSATNLFGLFASFMNRYLGNPNLKNISDIYGIFSFYLISVLLICFVLTAIYVIKMEKNGLFLSAMNNRFIRRNMSFGRIKR